MTKLPLFFSLLLLLSGCSSPSGTLQRDIMVLVSDGIIQSQRSGLMWQQQESRLYTSPKDALHYAQELTLGGFTDWRIPTKVESHDLYFSLDFGESMAEDLDIKLDRALWVRFQDGELVPGVWDTGEGCCIIRVFKKDRRARVRAVRP